MELYAGVIAALAVSVPCVASAQRAETACRSDELRVVIPTPIAEGTPAATVRIERSGRDPFDGPPGGTCVIQGETITHVPDGARREFQVPASQTALTEFEIQGEHVHVSLAPGASVRLVSSPCSAWRIEGDGLDEVDHTGARPGATASLVVVTVARAARSTEPHACSVGADNAIDPPETQCRIDAQTAYCAHPVIRSGTQRHSFWLRAGETWTIALDDRSLSGTRTDRRP